MLPLLISIAWLAFLYVGLTMCRVAAHSDKAHTAALVDWLTLSSEEREPPSGEQARELPGEIPYRATG